MSEWDELLKLKTKPPKEKELKEEKLRVEKKKIKKEVKPEIKKLEPEPRGKARSIQELQKRKKAKVQLKDLLTALDITELTAHQKRALKLLQTSKPDWRNRKKDTVYYQKEVTLAGLELILSLLMQKTVKIEY